MELQVSAHWDVWRDSLHLFSIAYRGRLPDYVRQTKRLTIPICAKYFCYNISTIDNLSVENHEYFNVTLTHGRNGDLNERINISTPTKRYEILDDDSKLCSSYWEVSCLNTVCMLSTIVNWDLSLSTVVLSIL